MAEFKNGKINGKIGPLVYRYLNDKTIIQAAPRRIKPRGGTIVENEKFGEASHFTSAVYESLKEFGLNRCYSYLFGRLVSYFKKVFYSGLKDQKLGKYVNLDKKDDLSKLFSSYPKAEKDANIISVHVPSINVKGKDKKYANANFMNYEVKLFL